MILYYWRNYLCNPEGGIVPGKRRFKDDQTAVDQSSIYIIPDEMTRVDRWDIGSAKLLKKYLNISPELYNDYEYAYTLREMDDYNEYQKENGKRTYRRSDIPNVIFESVALKLCDVSSYQEAMKETKAFLFANDIWLYATWANTELTENDRGYFETNIRYYNYGEIAFTLSKEEKKDIYCRQPSGQGGGNYHPGEWEGIFHTLEPDLFMRRYFAAKYTMKDYFDAKGEPRDLRSLKDSGKIDYTKF